MAPVRDIRRRELTGFVLPFVLIAIAAASMLTFAFGTEALQNVRATRGALHGDDAAHAADLALADALASFERDSLWLVPPGVPRARAVLVNGQRVIVEWTRSNPLVAHVRATVQNASPFRGDMVRRDHYRAVWLQPPAIPIVAALQTNGPVYGREGTLLSGADQPVPGSACGLSRDTVSVAAVAASEVVAMPIGTWPGAPFAVSPLATMLTDLERGALMIEARVPALAVTGGARPLPPSRPWAALSLRGDTVAITGPAHFSGLLIARGALVLTGSIQITGLLLVRGPLDASAAHLSVQGAVLAADTSARGVMLGAQSRLFYDRCAVQMALAAVARPSLAPFSLWHSLPR